MSLTKIDWFGFRTKDDPKTVLNGLRGVFGRVGPSLRLAHRNRGWMGYDESADLSIGDMHVGLVAFGGDQQKGWLSVNITGRGCEWVDDWNEADFNASKMSGYETRRVDIALDTYRGEVTHESVVDAYHSGSFTTSGRPPKITEILPGEKEDGRTVYIGSRSQGKFLRAYEKGYEIVKAYAREMKVEKINGFPIEDIYRLELELKPKISPLPTDVIARRDQYFSGAYPYLQKVLEVEPEVWHQKREEAPQRDLEAALSQICHQYGSTLFTAAVAYHGDIGAVWDKVVGNKHNKSLLEKGVLLVDHI